MDISKNRYSKEIETLIKTSKEIPEVGYRWLIEKVKEKKPKFILEIGTYQGRTAKVLRMITGAEITTVDYRNYPIGYMTVNNENPHMFRQEGVTYLVQDSRNIDVEKFKNAFDVIFIDGGHTHDIVKSDTEKSLKMIKPNGLIIWHDYGGDVKKCLDEFGLPVKKKLGFAYLDLDIEVTP